jgi:hypothetical protein
MPMLTFAVDISKHKDACTYDDPSRDKRQIGFKVTATLRSDTLVASTLQETYKLQQYVKDSYWLKRRPNEKSEWTDTEVQGSSEWIRDSFGFDDALGNWHSTREETIFWDEPGFLGVGARHGAALSKLECLGYYEIQFKWEIAGPGQRLRNILPTTLKADPDDQGLIKYSIVPGANQTITFTM